MATWTAASKSSAPAWTAQIKSLVYDYLLMEDSSFLLLEDNGKIILDQSGTAPTWSGQSKNTSSWSAQSKS